MADTSAYVPPVDDYAFLFAEAFGEDVVARATGALNKAGLNILSLESDVGGHPDSPVYVMHIEGVASKGLEVLDQALQTLSRENDVVARMTPIDTMVG